MFTSLWWSTVSTPPASACLPMSSTVTAQGRYSPSLEMAFQIARVFRVSLEEVFQYPDGEGDSR